MACYVALAPEAIRGVYDTWAACEAVVRSVPGARYRKAADRALAEQLLSGNGRRLAPGQYAFTDGNHRGGIGVALVRRNHDSTTEIRELSGTVQQVAPHLAPHVERLRNPLAELVALFVALAEGDRDDLVVVHDYEGVGAWMEGRWRTRDAVIAEAVARCRDLVAERGLRVAFRWQRGHQSALGDEYAEFNAKADRLAARATSRPAHSACTTGEAMV
jgi:ribonuclease HI